AALLYAFAGGLVVTLPPDVALARLGAPHLLVASAALVGFGIAGSVGVAAAQRVFSAAVGTGAAAVLGALRSPAGASGAAAVALLLRGRLFPTRVQRVPMLVSGLLGLVLLAFGLVLRTSAGPLRLLPLLLLAVASAMVLTSGLLYSRRAPSPYVGRFADIFDVLAI